MYNLLIVDDERVIADGIYEFFKNEVDIELQLFKAYSAIQALSLMDQTKIDIIITDITMPGVSGLELQKEIVKKWPRCKIIFLTGYNQFEFIHAAVRNNSVDYILKTEDDEVVLVAVRKAINLLDNDLDKESFLIKTKNRFEVSLPVLRDQFILELVEGKEKFTEDIIVKFNDLKIPLSPESSIILLVGVVDKWKTETNIIDKCTIKYGIQGIVEEYFSELLDITSIAVDSSRLLWVLQPANSIQYEEEDKCNSWSKTSALLKDSLYSIQNKCHQLLNITVSFFAANKPIAWEAISNEFYAINQIVNKYAGFSSEVIITDISSTNIEGSLEDPDIRGQLKNLTFLESYLESGQEEKFNGLFNEFISIVMNKKQISSGLKMEVYYSISRLFLSFINKRHLYEKLKGRINIDMLMTVDKSMPDDIKMKSYQELAKLIFAESTNTYINNSMRTIEKVQDYIMNNLHADLSVNRLGEITHFNPSYLSRLFKSLTGKSISEYIWVTKLTAAKALLGQDDVKINKIALQLGFESPAYFTRFFKKYTKLTPLEYKDALLIRH